jgi:hypothetical protein
MRYPVFDGDKGSHNTLYRFRDAEDKHGNDLTFNLKNTLTKVNR